MTDCIFCRIAGRESTTSIETMWDEEYEQFYVSCGTCYSAGPNETTREKAVAAWLRPANRTVTRTLTDECAFCPAGRGNPAIQRSAAQRFVQCQTCGSMGPTGEDEREAIDLWLAPLRFIRKRSRPGTRP